MTLEEDPVEARNRTGDLGSVLLDESFHGVLLPVVVLQSHGEGRTPLLQTAWAPRKPGGAGSRGLAKIFLTF